MNMITKLEKDAVINQTLSCGEVIMMLTSSDYDQLNVAYCPDIRPTVPHYHPGFDEIYFVLDGWILVRTYDPEIDQYFEQRLGQNELILMPKGMHHVIAEASESNRLCVLMIPGFTGEIPSDRFNEDREPNTMPGPRD